MTNPSRLKDLSDVLELIKLINLPADFSQKLDPYVRDKYLDLWQQSHTRYMTLWRNKGLTAEAKTIDDMIALLKDAARTLEEMRREGVVLEDGGAADDYAHLVTTDPDVAKKYDMMEESELWAGEEDESSEGGDVGGHTEDSE